MDAAHDINARLERLGITLPRLPVPVANFTNHVLVGDLLFLSGQTPPRDSAAVRRGLVGTEVTVAEARHHARLVGLSLLTTAREAVGDLSRIKRVVKLFGMVRAAPDFDDHPEVIDGCSDLFCEVFGEAGRHARSAVGMGSLPGGATVEIEAILQVRTP